MNIFYINFFFVKTVTFLAPDLRDCSAEAFCQQCNIVYNI